MPKKAKITVNIIWCCALEQPKNGTKSDKYVWFWNIVAGSCEQHIFSHAICKMSF